jgi:hypothetical protein
MGRLMTAAVLIVIAPYLTGVIFMEAAVVRWIFSPGAHWTTAVGVLWLALVAIPFGAPFALVTMAGLLAWRWTSPTISLKQTVLAALPGAIAFAILMSWRPRNSFEFAHAPLIVLSTLASAALCWRMTKRWHSPAA